MTPTTYGAVVYITTFCIIIYGIFQGRIQDFKLGRAHLKQLRRAEGDAKFVWVFRVENHDFTPKKSYFFQFRGGEGRRRVRLPSRSAPVFQ